MNTRPTALFPVLLLALLTGATFWLDYVVEQSGPAARRQLRHDPDFVIENFTITSMGADGKPASRLAADRMTHYPVEKLTEVGALQLMQTSQDAPPVHISADRATVSENGDELRLYDNVVVVREATKDRGELRLETPYLHYLRDAEIADTPSPVVITEDGSRVEGVGMEMNGKTHWFEVKSAVRATFVRSKDGA